MAWQGCFSQHGPEGPGLQSERRQDVSCHLARRAAALFPPIGVSAGRQGLQAQATYAALIRPTNRCGIVTRNFCYTTLAWIFH